MLTMTGMERLDRDWQLLLCANSFENLQFMALEKLPVLSPQLSI
jgi:hypothetical protein